MATESSDRIALLQGTLDMLILRILLFGPAHGHQIAKHIQCTTADVLQVEHGSLAGKKRLIAEESKWKQLTGAIARIMSPAEES